MRTAGERSNVLGFRPAGDLILAVDCGSSTVRAVLFDAQGSSLAQASRPIAVTARGLRSEIDPSEMWRATTAAIAAIATDARRIAVVGVTAALGLVLADAAGEPLTPVMTWQDRRAVQDAAAMARRCDAARIYAVAGRRVDPELTAPRLAWFARKAPDLLGCAAHALSPKDWLVQRLCGMAATDPASASYSLLLDVGQGAWNLNLLREFGLPGHLLPPVCSAAAIAGHVTPEGSRMSGLRLGTPVIVGGPDGSVGCVGGGMAKPGIAVNVIGTTDVVLAFATRAAFDSHRRLVLNRFPVGQAWSLGGPTAATGGAAAWFAGLIGRDLRDLTVEAAGVAPGADGLMMSPVFAGSRAPRWDAAERGGLTGLSFDHGAEHLFRALLEGCAYDVAEVFDAIGEGDLPIQEIRAVGGGTENELWLAIRAAVLGRPLVIPEVVEASALGTAMLAAVGAGIHPDLSAASERMVRVRTRIEPDPVWVEAYARARPGHAAFRRRLAAERTGAEP